MIRRPPRSTLFPYHDALPIWLQSTLVVGEVSLALVLLVGAGLLVRSLIRLNNLNPGFDTRDVLAAPIPLTPAPYPPRVPHMQFFAEILAALEAPPDLPPARLAVTL